MEDRVRDTIAAIARTHFAGGGRIATIYSHDSGHHRTLSGTINASFVQAYDHDNSHHITGQLPRLYHHGTASHIDLMPGQSGEYRGYDHSTHVHFLVRVRQGGVSVYDHERGEHFHYT